MIVLGAGISAQARTASGVAPKTWGAFLSAALAQLSNSERILISSELIKQRDFLTACEVIKDGMGSEFADFVRSEFVSPGYRSAPIHETINKLDARLVLTPNFDKIYETHVSHSMGSNVIVKTYDEDDIAEVIRGSDRSILKIHGSIDSPSRMIFTRSEYANARHEFSAFYKLMEALIMTHTFLFLGCGLDDPDMRLLLEDYAFRFKYGRPHYFVVPSDRLAEPVRIVVEKSLNVEFLTYDSTGDHRLLSRALEELVVEVNLAKGDLLKTGAW